MSELDLEFFGLWEWVAMVRVISPLFLLLCLGALEIVECLPGPPPSTIHFPSIVRSNLFILFYFSLSLSQPHSINVRGKIG
ncbi:Uncharacterized protein APZ42_021974 [Daphnia magna]|uniref:Uncharacterized protein n=1 Tax=Daphnia magna TaxID=35525 RepID=A0A164W6T5_9CRUS|nr:Uncharacterized protein APZ42_021974 [Daphnia magna]